MSTGFTPFDTPSPLLGRPGAVPSPTDPLTVWHYGDPLTEQRHAARGKAALVDGWACGALEVTGPERLTWLHTVASQDMTALTDGAQSETLLLSPRGHIEHWAQVLPDSDAVQLRTDTVAAAAALAEFLQSRIFRADVEVRDLSAEVAFVGMMPASGSVDDPTASTQWRASPRSDYGREVSALIAGGARPVGQWAWDALRVASRHPRIGVDTDDRSIPHELPYWLQGAVSLTKGCFPGGETVIRIENVGAPPRRLVLLNLDGSADHLPATGDDVTSADGRVVGRVGTVAQHWEDGPIALALVKRTIAPGVPLVAGGVDALIDPDDVVPPGPKMVFRRSDFIDLRRR